MENGPNEVSGKNIIFDDFRWISMFFLMIFASAADLGRCRRHKIGPKNIFQPTFFFLSTKMCWNFFRRKKLSMKKIWLPIPMGNFPKIPKITLRTACEHFKKQLEQKVTVYVLLAGHGMWTLPNPPGFTARFLP